MDLYYRQKALKSEPIVDEPIIELKKNCEGTETIISRSFNEKNLTLIN